MRGEERLPWVCWKGAGVVRATEKTGRSFRIADLTNVHLPHRMNFRAKNPMYWVGMAILSGFALYIGLDLWGRFRLSRNSLSTFGHVTSVEVGRHGYKYVYYCYSVNDLEYCDRLNIVGMKECEDEPKKCVGNRVYIDYLPSDPDVHKASIDW